MGRVIIERVAFGALRVRLEPPMRGHKARFAKFDQNKRFSGAVAYAADHAARLGYTMEDQTGRLSDADCAALVEAMRQGPDYRDLRHLSCLQGGKI